MLITFLIFLLVVSVATNFILCLRWKDYAKSYNRLLLETVKPDSPSLMWKLYAVLALVVIAAKISNDKPND